MKTILCTVALSVVIQAAGMARTDFNSGWLFSRDSISWRQVSIPHDWSIESLPEQDGETIIGPFSQKSEGAAATGNTVGGTAWYRRTVSIPSDGKRTFVEFGGVYMDSHIRVNGQDVAVHPYGYTPFEVELTDALVPGENVLEVKVCNEGKNSRWYAGSGIFRPVKLYRKAQERISWKGVFVSTLSADEHSARIRVNIEAENPSGKNLTAKVKIGRKNYGKGPLDREITLKNPKLWSPETPCLQKVKVVLYADGRKVDAYETFVGLRTVEVDAENGLRINGKPYKMRGACMHHDNGFLGAAAIDRAEERRVQLVKSYGFNAIRCSHNPQSQAFLDACDREGILVVDEAFDMWERPKNDMDYSRFFKEWSDRDIEAMVRADRNHPSVIMWSIGNEINERAEALGYTITRRLVDRVHTFDTTRPVTEAICHLTDHPGQDWETTAPAYAMLDVGGYNYLWWQYAPDHELHPERVMMGTESTPDQMYDTWKATADNSYVIGDFLWTGMDHLGESGIGACWYNDHPYKWFCQPWPWYVNFSGDIDLCGHPKPQYALRKVSWGLSDMEINVHYPIPEGKTEELSYWGWPDEWPMWNWDGCDGDTLDVRVFSREAHVRLFLNGKPVGESESIKNIACFKVPYEPGELKAESPDGRVSCVLRTTGKAVALRMTADRNKISRTPGDLSFVTIEAIDRDGNLVPDCNLPITLSISGKGEIAGCGNASPTDMAHFNNPSTRLWHGRAMAILRPTGKGRVVLKAEGEDVTGTTIRIKAK